MSTDSLIEKLTEQRDLGGNVPLVWRVAMQKAIDISIQHQADLVARLEALKPCGGEMHAIGMSEMKRKAIAIVRGGV